jgi:hypothetical protein
MEHMTHDIAAFAIVISGKFPLDAQLRLFRMACRNDSQRQKRMQPTLLRAADRLMSRGLPARRIENSKMRVESGCRRAHNPS